ncbi:MAG: hypothetical protein ABIG71_01225 [Candidatus Uhrbacteria bacterium]
MIRLMHYAMLSCVLFGCAIDERRSGSDFVWLVASMVVLASIGIGLYSLSDAFQRWRRRKGMK